MSARSLSRASNSSMAQSTRTLSLRILSPSAGLGDSLDMANVPLSTTIGMLKQLLMEKLPSNPTPDRMRLIHFGRLLANENETLGQLFGEAALTQTTPFTLHLVVRAPPTPIETAATRQPLFASWGTAQSAGDVSNAPRPNILPPGTAQHPLMPPGAAFVPQPQGATATPTPTIQHGRAPSANLLQQLMERQQEQMRQLHANRPQTQPPQHFPAHMLPAMPRPTPPTSAPGTPAPFAHHHPHTHVHHHHPHLHAHPLQHPHPQGQQQQHQQPQQSQPHQHQQQHRTATITINQSTIAIPMPLGQLGQHGMPMGQMPLPGFPNIHNLVHQQPQPQVQQFNPSSPTVYLLSSPTGPQALLFSPQGTYTASLPPTPMLSMPGISNPPFGHTRPHTPAAQAPPPPGFNPPPVVVDPQQAPEQIAQQLVQQINRGGAENQEPNALAPWQPLLAHGWMLLRLLFFAWIFLGSGQGWRRPLALLAIGIVFWAINAGGIGNTIRDTVQSWWETVVELPGQPQPQQQGALRQALRPAERLLALLIASLWPGVGERTVVARREAEERQRREEGERLAAEAERQRLLEAEPSSTAQEGESVSMTTIRDEAATTATGNDVAAEGQEVRERKTATHEASAEQTSAAEPTLTREEQRAQQLQNLAADW
ncbi:hypothetical protein AUEXF2481DRAFT_6837 [Aureobasidium subglaciale EXF-2481]|uniref:Ubiquitin-like domain-containing protein n=1 Tax=Aureobasidium subglaciale (strain EXF-2481) TaxID=1043005 RepID=A0A074Y6A0_AURSE|nr:uncharacterized protein AUEXF2481DRAFT_6837 [Aureobasidium subglaciale EXF-2481]KEQ93303.1 hypothetical protein AUEXF2481DRAFT_6837 [Aureobasidium subglaciale EXF-2481]